MINMEIVKLCKKQLPVPNDSPSINISPHSQKLTHSISKQFFQKLYYSSTHYIAESNTEDFNWMRTCPVLQ